MSPDLIPGVEEKRLGSACGLDWDSRKFRVFGMCGSTLGRQNEGDIKLIFE
jgi:hypothetical protein